MGNFRCLSVGCGDTSIIDDGKKFCMVDCYSPDDFKQYLPKDKIIHALFITHHHYDHFKGMDYLLKNKYTVNNIVYSPYERRYNDHSVARDEYNELKNYISDFKKKGAKTYSPFRQTSFDKPWWKINDNLKVWMIGPFKDIATSDTRELHDASLVFKFEMGKRKCLFTGDASDKSLIKINNNTNHHCDDILHCSHHGSINGADLDFIKGCKAEYTVVSTKSGVHDNVPHQTALQRYRNNTEHEVYRTDVSGNLRFSF